MTKANGVNSIREKKSSHWESHCDIEKGNSKERKLYRQQQQQQQEPSSMENWKKKIEKKIGTNVAVWNPAEKKKAVITITLLPSRQTGRMNWNRIKLCARIVFGNGFYFSAHIRVFLFSSCYPFPYIDFFVSPSCFRWALYLYYVKMHIFCIPTQCAAVCLVLCLFSIFLFSMQKRYLLLYIYHIFGSMCA